MKILAGMMLALAVVAVVVIDGPPAAAAIAAVAFVAASILDRRAVVTLLRAGFGVGVVFAAAVTFAVVAWAEGPDRGLASGALVLFRLLVLATAAAVLARGVDADRVFRWIAQMGLERTGLVLGLALNSLPRIAEITSEVWLASAVRSRGPLDRIRKVPALGEVLLAHTARIADEAAAAAALRGHRALTAPRTRLAVAVRTVVVTGTTNCGKTEALVAAVERLSEADVAVSGFIQTAVWEGDRKTGFEVADVASDRSSVTIATRVGPGRGQHGTAFVFHEAGFEAARTALRRAAAGSLLVVDELGPVELRGGGHLPAVKEALRRSDLGGFVVVVRRSLVPSLLAVLEATDATIVDVEHHGARSAEAILDALGETPAG